MSWWWFIPVWVWWPVWFVLFLRQMREGRRVRAELDRLAMTPAWQSPEEREADVRRVQAVASATAEGVRQGRRLWVACWVATGYCGLLLVVAITSA